jgi:hypothetical protein
MTALWLTVCLGLACHTLPVVPDQSVGVIGGVHGLKPDLHGAPFSVLACQSAGPSIAAQWPLQPGERMAGWRCGPEERAS